MDVYRKVPKPTNITPPAVNHASEAPGGPSVASIAPLITMIAVLAIILIFCFCGAPAVRQFCRKRVCCCCPEPEADESAGTPVDTSTTPTIILLPFGRMLVVDRSVFAQFQTDDAGLDFMELSANLIRAHHLQYGSTPSILDSETTSKGLSPTSLGLSPPTYDEICGIRPCDLPPSYSEVSLMFKQTNMESTNRLNTGLTNSCVQNSSNNRVNINRLHIKLSPGTSSNVHIENECVPERKYLASEENFEEFDEMPRGSGGQRLNRVVSHASVQNPLGSKPKPFCKQSSF